MSRRRVHPRAYVQLVLFVVGVALTGAVITFVQAISPQRTLDAVAPSAPGPDDPAADFVECERTLPEAPDNLEDAEEVDPVGRVASGEVLECPSAFDGHVVVYIGEVVGDVLRRDGGAWVLMNDDRYALEVGPLTTHREFHGTNSGLSVWLPDPLVDLVEHPGRAGRRGDVLAVRGVVRRADPADGGGLTLRALDAEVLAPSEEQETPVNVPQAVAAVAFLAVAAVVTVIERRVARAR